MSWNPHVAFDAIPVIDIAPLCDPLCDPAGRARRQATGDALHTACREVGFFYVVNHGCPASVSAGVRAAAREWFGRPEEVKRKHAIGPRSEGRGYQGLGANVTRYDGGFTRDWHEAIDLFKDFDPDHPDVLAGRPLHVPNVRMDDALELHAAIDAWRDEALRLGAAILRGIALGLGLDERFFEGDNAGDPFWIMRVIHYPPLPSSVDGEEGGTALHAPDGEAVAAAKSGAHTAKSVPLSCGEHTDYGLLTIVNQDDDVTALQVQNAAGAWVDATPVPGAFVCNIGDMLQLWTNGMYKPTVHRVLNVAGEARGQSRISVPFFYEPNFDARVEPMPQFFESTGGRARFDPVVYGEHLTRKVYSNFETEDITEQEVPSGSTAREGRPPVRV